MNDLLEMLTGGDLRSEGRAAEVAATVIKAPDRLSDLAAGLREDDKLIRARTCMALEVVSRSRADLLLPLVPVLIDTAEREAVAQARWHLAEIFCCVSLEPDQTERVIAALLTYLDDRSKIVTYCAVQALGVVGGRSPRKSEIATEIKRLAKGGKSLAKAAGNALRHLEERSRRTSS